MLGTIHSFVFNGTMGEIASIAKTREFLSEDITFSKEKIYAIII